jgi:predicted nucleotidyltransferase
MPSGQPGRNDKVGHDTFSEDGCLSRPGISGEGKMVRIPIDQERIEGFCRRHHILRLCLFGCVLREDYTSGSDVDVLVEFEPGRVPGLAFFAMEMELSEVLGYPVDLNTPGFLSPHFRDRVLAEAETQYVRAA